MLSAALLFAQMVAARPQVDSVLQESQHHNWYIKTTDVSGSVTEGRIREMKSDTLVFVTRRRVPIDAIQRIEHRTSYGGGWAYGGAAGALVFGAFSYGISAGLCESASCKSGIAFLEGGLFGFALGAVVGSVVMPAEHKWIVAWH